MARHDDRIDPRGCFWSLVRFAGCFLILYIIMALAILAVGLLSRIVW